ncbi:type III pantothenate kinase [Rubrobacter taiwanensis]|uniref:type III pantothenate kinase n=1 Tax=Rubrobacter taiwanensis TaxID=185139 RepID=UPI001A9F0B48|nr:type III pantothenate kinase [Rubrobacter taiwanensis]
MSVLLAVDVGNTQTVFGVFEGEELRGRWRISTEASRTPDELAAVCAALLELRGLRLEEVRAFVISSVVPVLTRSYCHLAEDYLNARFLSVGPEIETGMPNRYDDPSAVGADRIVNAVAARTLYGAPVIIVDSGTATTVCAVGRDGEYLGGAIFPGLHVALDALISRAARLPAVDIEERPPKAIATNTPDSIRSGFVYGYAGAVDALVRRFREELGSGAASVATGGVAPAIVPHCREIDHCEPDLTLKGLRILYELNS